MMEWFFVAAGLSRTGRRPAAARSRYARSLTTPQRRNQALHAIDGVVSLGNRPLALLAILSEDPLSTLLVAETGKVVDNCKDWSEDDHS